MIQKATSRKANENIVSDLDLYIFFAFERPFVRQRIYNATSHAIIDGLTTSHLERMLQAFSIKGALANYSALFALGVLYYITNLPIILHHRKC